MRWERGGGRETEKGGGMGGEGQTGSRFLPLSQKLLAETPLQIHSQDSRHNEMESKTYRAIVVGGTGAIGWVRVPSFDCN